MLAAIALRNVTRRKSRSLLLALTVGVGVLMMLAAIGYNRGVAGQMTEMVVQSFTGDLLLLPTDRVAYDVFKPGKPTSPVIQSTGALQAKLAEDPNVLAVSPHNRLGGLLQAASLDQGAILVGMVPSVEATFNKQMAIRQGEALSDQDPTGILVSEKTATELSLQVGSAVTWVSSDRTGHAQERRLTVRGIYRANPYAGSTIYGTLALTQELLGLTGDQAQEVLVLLRSRGALAETQARLEAVVAAAAPTVAVYPWQAKAGFFTGLVLGNAVSLGGMVGILFVAILIGLVNAVVMIIKERTGEIGALMAMGTSARRILGLLVIEQFCLTEAAVLVASAVGFGLITWLGQIGIPASNAALQFAFGGERLRLILHPAYLLLAFLIVGGVSVLATLLAGLSILRLKPVEALRELT